MSRYLVWTEDESRDEARRINACCSEQAAEEWAEWADAGEYTIARGNPERLFVALDVEGYEPSLYEVRGECVPVYSATAVCHTASGTEPEA